MPFFVKTNLKIKPETETGIQEISSFALTEYFKIRFSFIFFSNSMSIFCGEDTRNIFTRMNAHPDFQMVRYVVLTLWTHLCTRHLWKECVEWRVGCYFHYTWYMFLFFNSTGWKHLNSRRHTPMTSTYCLVRRSSEHCYQISVVSMCFNTVNAELNPTCHLLALLGAHHILHVSGIKVNCSFTVCAVLNQLVGPQ